jgi:hypothetical protein
MAFAYPQRSSKSRNYPPHPFTNHSYLFLANLAALDITPKLIQQIAFPDIISFVGNSDHGIELWMVC